jgi:D-alanine-D-alanine ligase
VRLGFTYNVRSKAAVKRSEVGLADDAEEEFDSQETVDAIAGTLRSLGHDVELLGEGEPLLRRLLGTGASARPEMVFNMAEGTGCHRSREARVPAVLEMLGIPHTGSDPLTLAVALDKPLAKTIVAAAEVAVPRGVVVHPAPAGRPWLAQLDTLVLPVIVKPAFEGSSKGILDKCLIEERGDLAGTVESLLRAYQQPVLIEEFIDGDELTVGILGNAPPQVLGVMRVPRIKPSVAATWRELIFVCAEESLTSSKPTRCRGFRPSRATSCCWQAGWGWTTRSCCGKSWRLRQSDTI